ncbi:MAG: hypothetical protein MK142_02875, partial [Pseudomonadales bacterium]|nr:hypothetical protein [Pseudomonadales bacterium]
MAHAVLSVEVQPATVMPPHDDRLVGRMQHGSVVGAVPGGDAVHSIDAANSGKLGGNAIHRHCFIRTRHDVLKAAAKDQTQALFVECVRKPLFHVARSAQDTGLAC